MSSPPAAESRDKPQSPKISLISNSDEATLEANRWLSNLFKSSAYVCISNNFIQHFGEKDYQQLSYLNKNGVSIKECFKEGHASISVKGDSHEDVVVAGMQVEAMLCIIQSEFVKEKEDEMFLMSTQKVSFERKKITHTVPMLSDLISAFKDQRLRVLKVKQMFV